MRWSKVWSEREEGVERAGGRCGASGRKMWSEREENVERVEEDVERAGGRCGASGRKIGNRVKLGPEGRQNVAPPELRVLCGARVGYLNQKSPEPRLRGERIAVGPQGRVVEFSRATECGIGSSPTRRPAFFAERGWGRDKEKGKSPACGAKESP